jgi:hypothetical protein
MPFNINDSIKKASEEFGLGGDYFKVKEGDNRIRILSHFVPNSSEFTDKKTGEKKQSFKFVAWIIDRNDGQVKPYFMPMRIAKEVGKLQSNPEYAFEDMPMPYDITINVTGAGQLNVDYKVIPARANTPLTAEEEKALKDKMPIAEFVAKLSGDQSVEETFPGAEEVKREATPFE